MEIQDANSTTYLNEVVNDTSESKSKFKEEKDKKKQLFIGTLLIVCMVLGIISVFIPVLIPYFIAPITLIPYADIFSGKN